MPDCASRRLEHAFDEPRSAPNALVVGDAVTVSISEPLGGACFPSTGCPAVFASREFVVGRRPDVLWRDFNDLYRRAASLY